MTISIITQVIVEILALSLAENSRYTIFQNGPRALPRFVDVSEEEINFMKENAIPRNTKHATKFGMTLFKDKMWKLC